MVGIYEGRRADVCALRRCGLMGGGALLQRLEGGEEALDVLLDLGGLLRGRL